MPQFSYKAKAASGQIITGTIQAENSQAVIKKLRQDSLYPLSIEEANPQPIKKSRKKIRSQDISAFTRQLANLVRSGFPLATAISTLSSQEQNRNLKKLIEGLQENIQKGSAFSGALEAYPESFSHFYLNMIRIGEATGKLDETLQRLADFKEKEDEMASQVKSSLAYPAFLLFTGVVTIFLLLTFFIPRLSTIFSEFGQALPLPTQIIVQLGKFMHSFWWLLIIIIAVAVFLLKANYKLERNRLAVDAFFLKLPFVNNVIQKLELSKFCYSLSLLLRNGVPMLESLKVVALSVNNRLFRKEIAAFQDKIKKGSSLSNCLKEAKIFPLSLINTVTVGEESGELTDMLLKTASVFETEVNRNIKTAVSLIEPILIVFIGGIVILMAMAILLPVFQLNFSIK